MTDESLIEPVASTEASVSASVSRSASVSDALSHPTQMPSLTQAFANTPAWNVNAYLKKVNRAKERRSNPSHTQDQNLEDDVTNTQPEKRGFESFLCPESIISQSQPQSQRSFDRHHHHDHSIIQQHNGAKITDLSKNSEDHLRHLLQSFSSKTSRDSIAERVMSQPHTSQSNAPLLRASQPQLSQPSQPHAYQLHTCQPHPSQPLTQTLQSNSKDAIAPTRRWSSDVTLRQQSQPPQSSAFDCFSLSADQDAADLRPAAYHSITSHDQQNRMEFRRASMDSNSLNLNLDTIPEETQMEKNWKELIKNYQLGNTLGATPETSHQVSQEQSTHASSTNNDNNDTGFIVTDHQSDFMRDNLQALAPFYPKKKRSRSSTASDGRFDFSDARPSSLTRNSIGVEEAKDLEQYTTFDQDGNTTPVLSQQNSQRHQYGMMSLSLVFCSFFYTFLLTSMRSDMNILLFVSMKRISILYLSFSFTT